MVTDDGGEPLQNAHQSEKNHDGRRTAQSDDGKVLFAEVAGHQGVDCGCAHQRQIGDEDRGGEFGKRPEADIGLGGVVRNDFRVFVVGFDGFAHTKKDSRKGNPGEGGAFGRLLKPSASISHRLNRRSDCCAEDSTQNCLENADLCEEKTKGCRAD